MKKNIKYWVLLFFAAAITMAACKKTTYTFGNIQTPSNVVVTTTIQGAASNATGDGSGIVSVSVSATNALAYKIFWGNGDSVLTTTGQTTYKYTKLDTNVYTISVNAIGTAGAVTTVSKQVKVLYKYQIPAAIITNLTNGSTKNWAVRNQIRARTRWNGDRV